MMDRIKQIKNRLDSCTNIMPISSAYYIQDVGDLLSEIDRLEKELEQAKRGIYVTHYDNIDDYEYE